MLTFVKDIFGIFKIFDDIYQRTKQLLIPERFFAWQTLIYLSLFSWLMSSLAFGLIKNLIAFFGWVFLIAGTAWYTHSDKPKPIILPYTNMPLGAVITGFLVSFFAFGHREPVGASNDLFALPLIPDAIVYWPTISAIITAIPEFFEGSGTDVQRIIPKSEIRQRTIVLVGCCMVLSCWIKLFFVTDNWLQEYPSLLADNFNRRAFVSRTEQVSSTTRRVPVNGKVILDRLSPRVEQRITGRNWGDVEKLLKDANNQPQNFITEIGADVVEKSLQDYDEKDLWRVQAQVTNPNPKNPNEYNLDLQSVWTGPTSDNKGYFLQKSCEISPRARGTSPRPEDRITVAEIECNRVIRFFAGLPGKK